MNGTPGGNAPCRKKGQHMIYLKLSEENFEYDVRGLLTSFYPGEEIVLRSDRIQGEKGPDKTLAVEYLDGRI